MYIISTGSLHLAPGRRPAAPSAPSSRAETAEARTRQGSESSRLEPKWLIHIVSSNTNLFFSFFSQTLSRALSQVLGRLRGRTGRAWTARGWTAPRRGSPPRAVSSSRDPCAPSGPNTSTLLHTFAPERFHIRVSRFLDALLTCAPL